MEDAYAAIEINRCIVVDVRNEVCSSEGAEEDCDRNIPTAVGAPEAVSARVVPGSRSTSSTCLSFTQTALAHKRYHNSDVERVSMLQ